MPHAAAAGQVHTTRYARRYRGRACCTRVGVLARARKLRKSRTRSISRAMVRMLAATSGIFTNLAHRQRTQRAQQGPARTRSKGQLVVLRRRRVYARRHSRHNSSRLLQCS